MSTRDWIYGTYIFILIFSVLSGIFSYRFLKSDLKIIFLLVVWAAIAEISVTVLKQNGLIEAPVYHVYNIIEISVISIYFLSFNNMKYKWTTFFSIFFWSVVGLTNIILFQPIVKFNSNMLIIESFVTIVLALYSLYKILLNDRVHDIFYNVNFWIWTLFLFYWSGTLFFWGYIEVIDSTNAAYYNAISYFQGIVNILFYLGLTLLFLLSRKKIFL